MVSKAHDWSTYRAALLKEGDAVSLNFKSLDHHPCVKMVGLVYQASSPASKPREVAHPSPCASIVLSLSISS